MASTLVCQCGCTELDTDPARGDVVCTKCGTVLEASLIVSEVQFEESAGGSTSALGQFVASDGRTGKTMTAGFYTGLKKESRELTLRNARRKITQLCNKMQLNQHCQDTAFNFFKMALHRRLTAGRKNDLVVAACIYITCRTEGTAHLLIDFSDTLKVGVYELGRTFLRMSAALHINVPAIDPCLYILRFAHRLDFGDKTHKVSMTALRLVQRMKRDWLHTGRRPSGICGAALLLAARMHHFNRTIVDVVKVVKVHQSTVRKRLMEFGETPTSSLTLNEFMTVDLEEEQDPPSFKAARKKDKEMKIPVGEVDSKELVELQTQIEQLLKQGKKTSENWETYLVDLQRSSEEENKDIMDYINGVTTESIQKILSGDIVDLKGEKVEGAKAEALERKLDIPDGIGPSLEMLGVGGVNEPEPPSISAALGLAVPKKEEQDSNDVKPTEEDGTLDLEGIDDREIDSYLLNKDEAKLKAMLWAKLNAEFLREQQAKLQFLAENPPPDKPKKKSRKRKPKLITAVTPGEAIEKMLQEKKISSKINYDVLRNLKAMSQSDSDPMKLDGIEALCSSPGTSVSSQPTLSSPEKPVSETSRERTEEEIEDDSVFVRPISLPSSSGSSKRKPSQKSPPKKKARLEIIQDRPSVKTEPKLEPDSDSVDIEEEEDQEIEIKPRRQLEIEGNLPSIPEIPEYKLNSVIHDDVDEDHDADDLEDDEEMSAAQLLSQHRRAMGDDFEEDDYY